MCVFCDALAFKKEFDAKWNKKNGIKARNEYSVAMVERMFIKGRNGCRGSTTDYRYRGCGYKLNFCPECGRVLKGRKRGE